MALPDNDETLPNMTPERWRQVRAVFERAIEIDAEDKRQRFVAETCGNDAALLREVLSLLEADQPTDDLLERPLEDHLSPRVTDGVSVQECPKCGLCLEQSAGTIAVLWCPVDGTLLEKAFDGGAVIDGKFLVEKRLGRGGMGAVYMVRHLALSRRFALKLILPSKHQAGLSRELFEQEAKALGRLKHRYILDVTDYGVDPRGMPYLVTELLEGTTLHARCWKEGSFQAMSLDEALLLFDQIAEAIDFVHASGLLHRDIKLSNVFLSDTVKLMDFGLAALADRQVAQPAMGTPEYMAPELIDGRAATVASDIYGFGVLAFVMLTGKLPLREPPLPSSLCSALPAELDAPLLAMLARDPASRPATARKAVAQIRAAELASRRRSWKRREIPRRVGMAAVGALLALVVVAGLERVGPVDMLELRAVDARFHALAKKPPDRRIVLVVMDEASLNDKPLASRADEFGSVLTRIFEAGGRSVAVDFLFPETWSRSREFSDLVLRHAEQLTLGLYSDPSGETVGTECVAGILGAGLGPQKLNSLFAFVNLEQDSDGAIRHGRMYYPDRSGAVRSTFASSAVGKYQHQPDTAPRFWLDFSIEADQFQRISWKDASDRAMQSPGFFAGKLVLVGGDYLASEDAHRVPIGGGRLAGIAIQALAADTILTGTPFLDAPAGWWMPLVVLLFGGVIAGALLLNRRGAIVGVGVFAVLVFSAANWYAFQEFGRVVPAVAPIATMLLALGGALLLRIRLPGFPVE